MTFANASVKLGCTDRGRPTKAVLWDMDGTLIDSEPVALEALANAMIRVGAEPTRDVLDAAIGMSADALYSMVTKRFGIVCPHDEWEALKHEFYLSNLHKVAAIAEAVEVWNVLEAKGVRQAVVTNSDRIITDANLRHIHLAVPGTISVCRNDVRAGKPAPESYLRAAWLLGVEPEEAVVVEDSTGGTTAGISAGMNTLIVPQSKIQTPKGASKLQQYSDINSFVGR